MFRYDPYWTGVDSFRALYDTIVALKPDAVPDYLLGPGPDAARPLMQVVEPYKRRDFPGHSVTFPEGGHWDDIWHLYALSRISDHLLLPFQMFDPSYAGPHIERWLGEVLPPIEVPVSESGVMESDELMRLLETTSRRQQTFDELAGCFPRLTADVYVRFFNALGFERFTERSFSPFYHEIVEVEESDSATGDVEIVREFWPGLRFGEMVFARAGVRVRCSSSVMSKPIAERSTLYWAHKRIRRRVEDLSIGWGHNSQWATTFRRDYEDDRHFYFNVDGRVDVIGEAPRWAHSEPPPGAWPARYPGYDLPIEARRELLIHRCLVRCSLPDNDRWPYYDRLTVRKGERFWLP